MTKCDVCNREFKNARGLAIHKGKSRHWYWAPAPPVPPPASTRRTEAFESELPETLRLADGAEVKPGDTIYQIRKLIVRKVTVTSGSTTAEVEAECVKRKWQRYEPTIM